MSFRDINSLIPNPLVIHDGIIFFDQIDKLKFSWQFDAYMNSI